jgi:hypothetical protein
MRLTRKYEFLDEAAADAAISILTDEEGNTSDDVIKLGYLVTTPATFDSEYEQITAPVYSDKYAVDVYWSDRPNQEWQEFLVWPTPMGIHTYGSSSSRDEYATAYCILYPNSTYCNPDEDTEHNIS